MFELKNIWDSMDSRQADISVEEQLDAVMSRIKGRDRALCAAQYAAFVLVPLVALAVFLTRPQPAVPQMLQCYVPNGCVRTLTLSDSTVVTLNAGTTFVYPENFSGSATRSVFLNGEASFSVAKDAEHPFVVSAPDFEVEVFGTVFNVSAYAEDKVSSVVLSEGRVKMKGESFDTFLAVGQKAEYKKESESLVVSNVDAGDWFAWQQGGIMLQRATIDDIIKTISRVYGMEVQCNFAHKYTEACITFKSADQIPVEEFLKSLSQLISGMKYDIRDNSVNLY